MGLRQLFIFAFFTVFATAAKAQWEYRSPHTSAFQAGEEYYLYNIESRQFFVGANAWGTQASVGNTGYKVKFYENGVDDTTGAINYVFSDFITTRGIWYNVFISNENGDMYVDGEAQENIYFQVNQTPGDTFYRITASLNNPDYPAKQGTALGISPGTTSVLNIFVSDQEASTHWQFVSPDQYVEYMDFLKAYNLSLEMPTYFDLCSQAGVDVTEEMAVYNDQYSSYEAMLSAYKSLLAKYAQVYVNELGDGQTGDVTQFTIINPSFTDSSNGWDTSGRITVTNGAIEAYSGFSEMERETGFDVLQTVTLPAGKYTMIANAFFRSTDDYNYAPDVSTGYLVAGNNRQQIKTLASEADALTAIPTSLDEAAALLATGAYENVLEFESNGTPMQIGFTGTFDELRSWVVMGPILLFYTKEASHVPEIPEDAIAQGETGSCIWYVDADGQLVIAPADGVSGDLSKTGWSSAEQVPWYEYGNRILSAKVMPGVNATSCSYMFSGLGDMASADLSGLNTENATGMGNMFSGCSSLTALDLSGFNTQYVVNMAFMFDGCSSLASLNLDRFNTQNVKFMYWMFAGCSSLTSLDLSGFNMENVTDMYSMFSGCSALTTINLSNFNTQKATSLNHLFNNCRSLTTINLSSFNTENVTDTQGMFSDCSALTSLDLSSLNTQNVESMSAMFSNCTSLSSLNLSGLNTEKVIYMNHMFSGCSALTTLDLSSISTQNVMYINNMFEGCTSLTSLDVSHFDTHNVRDMSGMFFNCRSLTSLDVSNFDTSNVTDMKALFNSCRNLLSLNLTNFYIQSGTEIDNIFASTNNLTTVFSDNETPSTLQAGMFSSLLYKSECTLLVPEGSEGLYAAADGWNELEIKAINEYLFGELATSVTQDEDIATDALQSMRLTYPNALAGTSGYEDYELSTVNMDAMLTLMDSESTVVEDVYAQENDFGGNVAFGTKLKRGETYKIIVPRGLYTITSGNKVYYSPEGELEYSTIYMLGDVNDDKVHSVTDVVGVVSYLLRGSNDVGKRVVDCNIDDVADIADITFLVEKVLTGEFPNATPARIREAEVQHTQLHLTEKGNALALSFDNSNGFCSMQFDVTLTDAQGNDITDGSNVSINAGNGLQGHSVTTGIVDGKLRVLVYSIANSAFSVGDLVTITTEASDEYKVSIDNAVLVTTGFASVRPDNAEASVSAADSIDRATVAGKASQIYDTNGRKMNRASKRGVLIVDGKKVVSNRIVE